MLECVECESGEVGVFVASGSLDCGWVVLWVVVYECLIVLLSVDLIVFGCVVFGMVVFGEVVGVEVVVVCFEVVVEMIELDLECVVIVRFLCERAFYVW